MLGIKIILAIVLPRNVIAIELTGFKIEFSGELNLIVDAKHFTKMLLTIN